VQNFANWFSYHRSRILAVQAGVTQAFAELDSGYRVGFCTINTCKSSGTTPTLPIPHGKFTETNKTAFFDQIINVPIPAQGTPPARRSQLGGKITTKNGKDDRPLGPQGHR